MGIFSAISFPKPKDWKDFERKARVLFACILEDPLTQTHGRSGQQDGIDILGRRGGRDGPLVGIQCKAKDSQYRSEITKAELKQEVEKAKRFRPPLDEFILITTAPDDARIQKAACLLERNVRRAGRLLSIRVWGWNTLEQHISEYTRAAIAFHPGILPVSDELRTLSRLYKKNHAQQDEKLEYLIETAKRMESLSVSRLPNIAFGEHDRL